MAMLVIVMSGERLNPTRSPRLGASRAGWRKGHEGEERRDGIGGKAKTQSICHMRIDMQLCGGGIGFCVAPSRLTTE